MNLMEPEANRWITIEIGAIIKLQKIIRMNRMNCKSNQAFKMKLDVSLIGAQRDLQIYRPNPGVKVKTKKA